jgi:hypothetical protein
MDLLVLDPSLSVISVLDIFESLIWTDRFYDCGDFEIYTQVNEETFNNLKPGNYIYRLDSDNTMIIEDRQITVDKDEGARLIVRGRTLESILDRRIIWDAVVLNGNLQTNIELLLNQNVISPTISARAIPNLTFEHSIDPVITALTIDTQLNKEGLYETLKKLCDAKDIGFRITLNAELSGLVFKLYSYQDRSYSQLTNSYVIFSRSFENLISSDYSEKNSEAKNITLIEGKAEDDTPIMMIVGSGSGLDRREIYTDAKDLAWTIDDVAILEAEYISHMNQKGLETLSSKNILVTSLECEADLTRMFIYREDFFIGDVVQLVSDYGVQGRAQIIEMIYSQNLSGIETHPKFKMVE